MLNDEQKALLYFLKCAAHGQKADEHVLTTEYPSFSWSAVMEMARAHNILPLIFSVAEDVKAFQRYEGYEELTGQVMAMVAEDPDWTNFTIYADENQQEAIQELILVGFYSYMSLRQTLLMHASAVSWNGQGLVFTAPSGTGKTTQAELWARYKGAKILNGDKVFLKQEEDAIHAWGSPWKGSSPYALNESAPLKAIVVLRQAKENTIRRLDTLEAMELFVPHVFFPKWDEKCEQAVLDFLDVVMSQTPIYLLCCRPDEEAVELTERTIFGESTGKIDGESYEK